MTKARLAAWTVYIAFACGTKLYCAEPTNSSASVYCFAIGVSGNSDSSLTGAPAAASKFCDAIREQFPSVKTTLLIDGGNPENRPSFERVEGVLDSLAGISPYSTVFFYFAGHGIRNPSQGYEEDLYLLLSGYPTTAYRKRRASLSLQTLVTELTRVKMINGVVVLDCCQSGTPVDPASLTGMILNRGDPESGASRFIYLFATGPSQQAVLGELTDDLIRVWRELGISNACVTPHALAEALRVVATKHDSKGARNRIILPRSLPTWCLAAAGQPRTLIIVIRHNRFRGQATLVVDDNTWTDLDFSINKYNVVAVAKAPRRFCLQANGHSYSVELNSTDLESDVVCLMFDGLSLARLRKMPDLPAETISMSEPSANAATRDCRKCHGEQVPADNSDEVVLLNPFTVSASLSPEEESERCDALIAASKYIEREIGFRDGSARATIDIAESLAALGMEQQSKILRAKASSQPLDEKHP